MQRRENLNLVPFDPEIERTFRKHRRENLQVAALNQTMAEDNINNGNNAVNVVPEAKRALRDYAVPLLQAYIQMIQSSVQFGRLPSDDPNAHLVNFLEICDTFKYNGVTDDAIRLRLFPFSLRDKAKSRLNSLPNGSITTWEELAQKFLTKFFSPAKTAKLRNDITSFTQFDVQTFYNGLIGSIKTIIDVGGGGALMSKNAADAYNLLEEMASNNYQWLLERSGSRKAVGTYEIDAMSNLAKQVAALSKKIDTMGVHAVQNSICEMCGDGHSNDLWPSNSNLNVPPSFQQQSRPPIPEKKSQVEELILQYMSKTNAIIQSYGASLRNLETQMGQLANSINSRPQGALPSDTQVNPKGKKHCNAVTLRSGKEVGEVNGKSIESSNEHIDDDNAIVEKEVEVEKTDNGQVKNQGNFEANYPPPPFPQRLKKQRLDKQFEKFLNVFKKLHINIPFVKALENMPRYVKFLKDILTKKRKLEDFKTVAFTDECVSIMPLSIAEKIRLNEIQPTTVSLQLAYRTIRYPVGIIEDVLVKVGHLYISVDFIVLEMEEDQ
ncbi:Retrotransposon gag domain - like 10 [Theobroma cacao]|nr:Retrotransposon gag domain - like 10 [Theobroma cacao]